MNSRIECARGIELCPTGCPIVDRLEQLKDAVGMQSSSIRPERLEKVREDTKTFGCPDEAFVEAVNVVFNPSSS